MADAQTTSGAAPGGEDGDAVMTPAGSDHPLSDEISINVKTLQNNTYPLRVSRNISVVDLKAMLERESGVSAVVQRLIYRGRVLKDDKALAEYNVGDEHSLHLVERPPDVPPNPRNDEPPQRPSRQQGPPNLQHVTFGAILPDLPRGHGPGAESLNQLMSNVMMNLVGAGPGGPQPGGGGNPQIQVSQFEMNFAPPGSAPPSADPGAADRTAGGDAAGTGSAGTPAGGTGAGGAGAGGHPRPGQPRPVISSLSQLGTSLAQLGAHSGGERWGSVGHAEMSNPRLLREALGPNPAPPSAMWTMNTFMDSLEQLMDRTATTPLLHNAGELRIPEAGPAPAPAASPPAPASSTPAAEGEAPAQGPPPQAPGAAPGRWAPLTRVQHVGVQCDACAQLPIQGPRFKSVRRVDFDLCQRCVRDPSRQPDGPFVQIDLPLPMPPQLLDPLASAQSFIDRMRAGGGGGSRPSSGGAATSAAPTAAPNSDAGAPAAADDPAGANYAAAGEAALQLATRLQSLGGARLTACLERLAADLRAPQDHATTQRATSQAALLQSATLFNSLGASFLEAGRLFSALHVHQSPQHPPAVPPRGPGGASPAPGAPAAPNLTPSGVTTFPAGPAPAAGPAALNLGNPMYISPLGVQPTVPSPGLLREPQALNFHLGPNFPAPRIVRPTPRTPSSSSAPPTSAPPSAGPPPAATAGPTPAGPQPPQGPASSGAPPLQPANTSPPPPATSPGPAPGGGPPQHWQHVHITTTRRPGGGSGSIRVRAPPPAPGYSSEHGPQHGPAPPPGGPSPPAATPGASDTGPSSAAAGEQQNPSGRPQGFTFHISGRGPNQGGGPNAPGGAPGINLNNLLSQFITGFRQPGGGGRGAAPGGAAGAGQAAGAGGGAAGAAGPGTPPPPPQPPPAAPPASAPPPAAPAPVAQAAGQRPAAPSEPQVQQGPEGPGPMQDAHVVMHIPGIPEGAVAIAGGAPGGLPPLSVPGLSVEQLQAHLQAHLQAMASGGAPPSAEGALPADSLFQGLVVQGGAPPPPAAPATAAAGSGAAAASAAGPPPAARLSQGDTTNVQVAAVPVVLGGAVAVGAVAPAVAPGGGSLAAPAGAGGVGAVPPGAAAPGGVGGGGEAAAAAEAGEMQTAAGTIESHPLTEMDLDQEEEMVDEEMEGSKVEGEGSKAEPSGSSPEASGSSSSSSMAEATTSSISGLAGADLPPKRSPKRKHMDSFPPAVGHPGGSQQD